MKDKDSLILEKLYSFIIKESEDGFDEKWKTALASSEELRNKFGDKIKNYFNER